jgi:alkaline phosphatase
MRYRLPCSVMALTVAFAISEAGLAASDYDTAASQVQRRAKVNASAARRAKNVILFVGDGMGISTITAARILEGQQRGQSGEENRLSFEEFPYSALVRTFSANQQTSDSAPTATAMVTGWLANDGALSVAPSTGGEESDAAVVKRQALATLLEQAEARGLATGIVTTTRITHATPAANYAHTPNRDWEFAGQLPTGASISDIALQLLEAQQRGNGIEVVLGGGRAFMTPPAASDPEYPDRKGLRRDGRDLIKEWVAAQKNSQFVWNRKALSDVNAKTTEHLLGLFEPSHMRYEADRSKDSAGEPSLAEMTTKALEILKKNRRGYYLMVEGGRIDHAHHAGNAYRALTDTIAFAAAVRAAAKKTDPRDTLILVTADHSHVMTIAGYPARGNPILGLVRSPGSDQPVVDAGGKPYTTISYANGPGFVIRDGGVEGGPPRRIAPGREADLSTVDTESPDFHQQSLVGMGAETHGGEDVALFARGPGEDLARGVINQNEIYHIMRHALGF